MLDPVSKGRTLQVAAAGYHGVMSGLLAIDSWVMLWLDILVVAARTRLSGNATWFVLEDAVVGVIIVVRRRVIGTEETHDEM